MPELNPLSNEQIFLKKIAENTGSDYNTGDVSEINPLTIDQILLKEIAANTAGQSGDITELEEKVEATQDIISDGYDSTHTYNVGDYCIHEDVLYKCNTASTTGTWDSSKWDAVTVADELEELTERVERGSVSFSFTTSMTLGQAVEAIFNGIDKSKVSAESYIDFGGGIFRPRYFVRSGNNIDCRMSSINAASVDEIYLVPNELKFLNTSWFDNTIAVDKSSENLWANLAAVFYY